jgi:hypothetical protein
MKCLWHKCGVEFDPVKKNQNFCKPEHRHAHNNYLKMTGIHFIPQIYNYIKDVADHCHVSVDEKANEMMLSIMGRTAEELKPNERPGEYLKTLEGLNE